MTTVAPNFTGPESRLGSITSERPIMASSSRIRPSMKLCRSRAAWYSAFSLKSPCSRASAIAAIIAGRSTDFSFFSSASSFANPLAVSGTFCILSSVATRTAAHKQNQAGARGHGLIRGASDRVAAT